MQQLNAQQQERVRLWVDALRSGEFQQGIGFLGIRGDGEQPDKFCCLGVACEVAIRNGVPMSRERNGSTYAYVSSDGRESLRLPQLVGDWLGLDSPNPEVLATELLGEDHYMKRPGELVRLAGCNDRYGQSFEQIANLIESTYLTPNPAGAGAVVTTVNKVNMQRWVDALRSGKFEQVTGALNIGGKFCCLGVACELAMADGVGLDVERYGERVIYSGYDTVLPPAVQAWLGVTYQNPYVMVPEGIDAAGQRYMLSWCNDTLKLSFNMIADLIEQEYLPGQEES